MSEVIESYIRRHPGQSEREAFEGFLNEERIKAWVGSDESRKERLRAEFGRVWGSVHVQGSVQAPRAGPSGPTQMQAPRPVRVEVRPEPAPAEPAGARLGPNARKLAVLCTNCRHMDVWMDGDVIQCQRCRRTFDDMLSLIRVTPVGPFEFLFGEGWKGAATGVGIIGGLVGLYYLLRWL